jgi:threonine/homoserine/homoserine lactone efflux protein
MITDKKSTPLGELFVLWLTAGLVMVFFAVAYVTKTGLPTEFIAANEILRLIQGGVFLLFGILALSTLKVDFKAAYACYNANIKASTL